ncbi:hypothetical protein SAMN03159284_01270 [Mucilaginibacter sp. NFR10]|nr:hypothetical protein SAMN03159284_01270 [Mucilaginibacter sp. NFR10]
MNTPGKNKEQTDEIGDDLESGNGVNLAIEQQGDDAAAGIPRDTDAEKLLRNWLIRAGPMPSVSYIPTNGSIPFGITCAMLTAGMPGYCWITFCSINISRRV